MKELNQYFMLAAFMAASGISTAATVADHDFNPGNWTTTIIASSGGASQSVSRLATGGNPGAYRQMIHNLPGQSSIVVAHQFNGMTYDPSTQGAISHLDYSEDRIEFNPPFSGAAIGAHPALLQNGTWYYGPNLVFTNLSWQTVNLNNLTAADFSNAGAHPDFSASGGVIHFGFTRSNSNSSVSGAHATTSGIDNWSFAVTTLTSTALDIAPASPSVFGQPLILTARVNGDSPVGRIAFKKDGVGLACDDGDQTVDITGQASCTLTNLDAGTYSFSAEYPGDGNNAASGSNPLTYIVNKADQIISGFTANPNSVVPGNTSTLTATASSGLAVRFASSTPLVCTLSGNRVTFLDTGSCGLTADQDGNANYNPAPQVALNISVNAAASATSVPTMSPWGLALLSLLLAGGLARCRFIRRKT